LARRAKSFVLLGDGKELYHCSPSGILQRCISIAGGQELLQEIHSGACGHHAAPRALVGNAFRQGFYWPTAVTDATRIVRTCQGCQFYARQTHLPAQALQTIPITWPFVVWGLDLVGPLQKAPGGYTHLLVAIDKFSKWIEVRSLNNIRSEQAVAFFTNIIHRFGVPNSIITDNGTQFTGRKFLDFCEDHHIRVDWAAVAHPMMNEQVERANGMILQGLKPRIYNDLNKFSKRWMKELPSVVWSLRTTPSQATGFTPFFLVYGAEAILPIDLEYGSPRTRAYDDQSNRANREDSLDQLEEARDIALLHSARYQQSLRHYHARGVRSRDLQVGRLGASAATRRPRAAQAHASLGRAVRHRQSSEARDVQAGQQSRRGLQQRLEHPTATSLLPLRCFQVVRTLRSHTKSNHQGRVSLASAKLDPPSGARRGEPPLRQNFPRKKIFSARMSFVLLDYFESGILKTTEYT
jgi:transposase InsO family protein